MSHVIVIGGGLSGLSAAHTVLERGGRVILFDKNPFMGGNSVKATSGINGALTRTQIKLGIKDSVEQFIKDTAVSATAGKDPNAPATPVARVLCEESAPAVHWLQDRFKLDLSLISRLGGHSFPRTHRGKEKFPGMTITYALMTELERIAGLNDGRAAIHLKTRVTKLLTNPDGSIRGVAYEKEGKAGEEYGPVIVATGGFAADFGADSILAKVRPDLLHLPTTNGDHCTGDGIKMAEAIGAETVDMKAVQVHPTGLVHPDDPGAKLKFLAAEALRGVGGLLLDANGKRFCNELGRRDYVSGEMMKNKGPFRLVLNSLGGKEIEWHCKHYQGRGLMKHFNNAAEFAKDMGVPVSVIEQTFQKYNDGSKANNDEFGKKYFQNMPFKTDDSFWVAIVTPVVHYCMGGLKISPAAEVENKGGPIPGLFATGEVCGGVHGLNRLGGSSLLDCVVFGRVAGDSVARYLLNQLMTQRATNRLGAIAGHFAPVSINVNPQQHTVSVEIKWDGQGSSSAPAAPTASTSTPVSAASPPAAAPAAPAAPAQQEYTMADVAKHNTANDCWVVVNGKVLNVTKFLPDHPGGAKAILLFAGKDATDEFNMLHQADVIEKYAPYTVIGTLKK